MFLYIPLYFAYIKRFSSLHNQQIYITSAAELAFQSKTYSITVYIFKNQGCIIFFTRTIVFIDLLLVANDFAIFFLTT